MSHDQLSAASRAIGMLFMHVYGCKHGKVISEIFLPSVRAAIVISVNLA